jgi:hypothetical protein
VKRHVIYPHFKEVNDPVDVVNNCPPEQAQVYPILITSHFGVNYSLTLVLFMLAPFCSNVGGI